MNYVVDTVGLRKAMAEKEVNTTEELAKRSGVNRNTLADVLNGKTRPSTSVMDRIAIALSMTPEAAGHIFFANNLRNT